MNKIILLILVTIFSSFTFLRDDEVTFTAKIENRNSDTLMFKGGNQFSKIIIADKKGVFKSTFKIEEGFYQMYDGKMYVQLYLKNGYDLVLNMDAKKEYQSITYKGKGADENNFWIKSLIDSQNYDYKTLLSSEEKVFSKLFEERKVEVLASLKGKSLDKIFADNYSKETEQSLNGLKAYYMQTLEAKKLSGSMSPDFNFENLKGGTTSLADLKGKYIYIDVWATWCGPCIAEIPFLKEVEKKYEGKNILFVSLSIDRVSDREKWSKFITEKELSGIQLLAEADWKSKFVQDYKINGIPRFILVGPNGEIVNADAPRPSSPSLIELFDNILK
ncbi:TlpA disulfide reductase family protein [Flavobacterium sp.]|jgi:thiol-disulfide isomerase/thioredoxin|uniref:TlpA family protein disulfide reductase n=1 Tax=Flavobacterium sp. TaxID=239 RepID=UPI002A81536B|nr:TlpA disulfide reductase family protein [Flavobacterium sp.]